MIHVCILSHLFKILIVVIHISMILKEEAKQHIEEIFTNNINISTVIARARRRTHELIWPQMKITYNKIEKTKAASFSCAINMFTKSCVKLHVVRSGTYGECGYRIRKLRVSTNCGLPTITEISQCRYNHQSQWNG